jgi:phenylpropionate dioxygenase-like ring-hydroxylating dioxygenase large terminal subunit
MLRNSISAGLSMTSPATSLDTQRQRPLAIRPPAEGEDGLFSLTWHPICLSGDVERGQVKGFDFLDGRVVVMRGEDGVAQVLSAYCPHLGADLAVGKVVGNTVRCAFHHWQYDCSGKCVKTAAGDPAPPTARLFRFPTVERYGVIFAFNAEQPLFDLPALPYPEDELLIRTERYEEELPVDPWVICCNTPDIQHIRVLHGIKFDSNDPGASAQWTDHSMLYEFTGAHAQGEPVHFQVGIYGTTVFYQAGKFLDRWFGFMSPMKVVRPGRTEVYMIIGVRRDEPDAEQFLDQIFQLERRVVAEDLDVLRTIRFHAGTLTASDRTLARFLDYLKRYPRGHASGAFIR